ncbi:MAG: phosphonate degradation HD-domain oxygenase [Reyranellaceae bacterium]
MGTTDDILELLARGDRDLYSGERVSQLEHALQCAHFAQQAGAADALVVATLVHDIGHILAGGELAAERGIDGRHEESGAAFLARHFGPEVCEPVRLHVAAKRYLCATDPSYFDRLSEASVRSLRLQGGPMSAQEVDAFESSPYAQAAVRLRQWDEQGKIVGLETPDLDHFRPLVAAALK